MDIYQVSMCKIMQAALEQFGRNGYRKTGVRHIAEASGVSLGLVNHYFGSKRMLGQQALLLLMEFLTEQVKRYVDIQEQPVLFDLTATRIQIRYLLASRFRQFYLDCMEEGVLSDSMLAYPDEVLVNLKEKYAFSDSNDYILLYSRYLPSYLEKILVLGKENGQFASIDYEDVPFIICRAAKERFLPLEKIVQADMTSRQLEPDILTAIPDGPDEDFVRRYICNLSLPLQ